MYTQHVMFIKEHHYCILWFVMWLWRIAVVALVVKVGVECDSVPELLGTSNLTNRAATIKNQISLFLYHIIFRPLEDVTNISTHSPQVSLVYLWRYNYLYWFKMLIILDRFITCAFVLDYLEKILDFNHSQFLILE